MRDPRSHPVIDEAACARQKNREFPGDRRGCGGSRGIGEHRHVVLSCSGLAGARTGINMAASPEEDF
jgi:hypothetical protein